MAHKCMFLFFFVLILLFRLFFPCGKLTTDPKQGRQRERQHWMTMATMEMGRGLEDWRRCGELMGIGLEGKKGPRGMGGGQKVESRMVPQRRGHRRPTTMTMDKPFGASIDASTMDLMPPATPVQPHSPARHWHPSPCQTLTFLAPPRPPTHPMAAHLPLFEWGNMAVSVSYSITDDTTTWASTDDAQTDLMHPTMPVLSDYGARHCRPLLTIPTPSVSDVQHPQQHPGQYNKYGIDR
ncbi:hypothetical protein EDD18DRAFT_1108706 [Armillaria luteobubalina]|uniref:G-patch domain-containing protein n=1 Tax=Armillaria luteobubalina TaxID=153913 RepID=A0AA39ULB1_9AGAR|nr:hypothetical protein EDD18DRAFT_1108706 [Armillaria luteobubalina]